MTFTLSDAIEHEKEMAESGYGSSDRANEHRQLSIWLEHYQSILNMPNCNDCAKKTTCPHIEWGQTVRFNCFDWKVAKDGNEKIE